MKVKMLKEWIYYKPGEIADVKPHVGAKLIERGFAESVVDKPKKKTKKSGDEDIGTKID